MAQTAGGTYYAASSELVSSWPATSLDLANQLESRFAAKAPLALSINAQTGTSYTLAVADSGRVVTMTNAAASTVTIPTNASVAVPIGSSVEVVNLSTGVNTTVSAAGGVTFNGGPVVLSPGSSVTLVKIGTDAWMAQGQGSPGLVHIATSTFSAVSSVSINNCFSSAYDNYQVLVLATTSTAAYMQYRLRASGSDATTNYSRQSMWGITTAASAGSESSVGAWLFEGNDFTGDVVTHMTLFRPNVAAATLALAQNYGVKPNVALSGGRHSTASAYDGLTIYPNAGNITGTARVYGIRN